MIDTENDTPLKAYVQRAATQPIYLAHALAAHRERFGLTEHEQRRHLGVRVEDWVMLCLCRLPETEEDLQVVCTRFGADRERLGQVLRAGS
jgi:hypothetical protein